MYLLLSALMIAQPAADDGGTGWLNLFDGRSLAGWKAGENPTSWKVVDGLLVADGPRSHLFYVGADGAADFRDFEFEAEVMTRPGCNSGVFFHTAFQAAGWPGRGFECQLNNSQPLQGDYHERKLTGSLYALRNIHKAPVNDNEWFKVAIAVRGKRIQIRINGALLVDYVEATPPAVDPHRPERRLGHGTIALQCHDAASKCFFRDLRLRRLVVAADDLQPVVVADEVDREIVRLGTANYPLVDFHTHLKGGLELEGVLSHMRATGINHGIAVNGGVGFPITDDAGIEAFRRSMAGAPCYIGLQAEGREWPTLFSREAISRFDYVFTDAMTIVDHRGRRARLWIPEEVEIPDKQAFMERLVTTIEDIIDREPIDFYANPTYLPDVLAGEYDALWTPERMQRVIDAAVRNGVAIEINSRLRLPSIAFLRRAKAAGARFVLGTNNIDRELGRLEYALEAVRACGLGWRDLWMPKPDGQKPCQVTRLAAVTPRRQ